MKKSTAILLYPLCALLTLLSISSAWAQSPELINYQAVVRDGNGNLVSNQSVSFRLEILRGSANGSVVYTERHILTTNAYGLANMQIGGGSSADDLGNVTWGLAEFFLRVSVDIDGGSNFTTLGTSQFVSVPYAMYAEEAGNIAGGIDASQLSGEVSEDQIADVTRSISYPAGSFSKDPNSTIIIEHGTGFRWLNNFSGSASLLLHKPADYAGGDVTFRILFRTVTAAFGVTGFFIRPRSYDAGNNFGDIVNITSTTVSVGGSTTRLYEQVYTIPASRLVNDWWYTSVQRLSSTTTYTGDLYFMGVTMEYTARQ